MTIPETSQSPAVPRRPAERSCSPADSHGRAWPMSCARGARGGRLAACPGGRVGPARGRLGGNALMARSRPWLVRLRRCDDAPCRARVIDLAWAGTQLGDAGSAPRDRGVAPGVAPPSSPPETAGPVARVDDWCVDTLRSCSHAQRYL